MTQLAAPSLPARRPLSSRTLRASPYPAAIGAALLAVARVQTARWERALIHVEEEQRATLRAILRRARNTELGRRQAFGGVADYEGFAHHVPIGDYDSHAPFIDRMRAGERGLLVPEFVRYFGNSSGSSDSGRSKFLPITETQIRHQQRAGADTVMRYLLRENEVDFVRGYTLGLFPPITMREEGPVLVTSNPALMVTRVPRLAAPLQLPDDACKRLSNYDEKLTRIAEQYLDWDVRAVAGTTCWFSLLFERVLEIARSRRRRAETISEVWPNLRVLFGGGIAADPYRPILRRLMGRADFTLVDSYNATEGGIYAVRCEEDAAGMLMLPHRGTFFEFVPLAQIDEPSPTRVPLWAVESGRNYAIVVTTTSGLYAYKLGDIVRFTSTYPHRIEFVGRLSGCLSLTQELTTHVEIERAVAHACEAIGVSAVDFGAAADVGHDGAKSRYVLYIEFAEGGAPSDLARFAHAFDEGVKLQNRVYREHRESLLSMPLIAPLVTGGARAFLRDTTRGNVQGKFPRIFDDARARQIHRYTQSKGQPDHG